MTTVTMFSWQGLLYIRDVRGVMHLRHQFTSVQKVWLSNCGF